MSLVDGWLVDDGSIYSGERRYGWEKAVGTRLRNATKDLLFDSLVTITGDMKKNEFFLNLDDGDYVVTLQIGDPSHGSESKVVFQNKTSDSVAKNLSRGDSFAIRKAVTVTGGKLAIAFNRPSKGGESICSWAGSITKKICNTFVGGSLHKK